MRVKKHNWFKIEFIKKIPETALYHDSDRSKLNTINYCIAKYRKTLNQSTIACAKKDGDDYIVFFHAFDPQNESKCFLEIYMDRSFVTTNLSLSNTYTDLDYRGRKSEEELNGMLYTLYAS